MLFYLSFIALKTTEWLSEGLKCNNRKLVKDRQTGTGCEEMVNFDVTSL